MYDRWFSQRVRAESLFAKLRPGFEGANVDFKNVRAWVASVMGIIMALFLLLVLLISLGENERRNKNGIQNQNNKVTGMLLAAGMGFGFSVFGGLITWSVVSSGNRRLKNRLFAFDDATKKYDIKSCGNYPITEDYGLPLFHSVEVAGCSAKSLNAWLCGDWKSDEFAWLQGGQLIDPLLGTVGDNAALNLGLRVVFGRKAKRENRLKRAGFDAIVFSEELHLPDIVLGRNKIFETGYTKRAVKQVAKPLPGMPASAKLSLYGATSDPRGCASAYGALADIVNSRNCLIQVIGGRVVVFLNCFTGITSPLVGSIEDVEREMEFAHTIFQRLKLVAQCEDQTASAPVDANVVAEAFKPQHTSRVSMGKVVAGICLLLFGGLGVLGAISAQSIIEETQKDIPQVVEIADQVEVKVCGGGLQRSTDSDGQPTAQPWIEYTYKMYGRPYKRKSVLSAEKAFLPIDEAKAMLGKYRNGMEVKAWYDPASPGVSSLTEKIVQGSQVAELDDKKIDLKGAITFSALLSIGGLGLILFGCFGNRQKAIILDFENSGSTSTPARQSVEASLPATEAEPEWGNLSSAKYFKDTPAGMLD